jgi:hypothetical protein
MLSDDGATQHWQATLPINSNPAISMRLIISRP